MSLLCATSRVPPPTSTRWDGNSQSGMCRSIPGWPVTSGSLPAPRRPGDELGLGAVGLSVRGAAIAFVRVHPRGDGSTPLLEGDVLVGPPITGGVIHGIGIVMATITSVEWVAPVRKSPMDVPRGLLSGRSSVMGFPREPQVFPTIALGPLKDIRRSGTAGHRPVDREPVRVSQAEGCRKYSSHPRGKPRGSTSW